MHMMSESVATFAPGGFHGADIDAQRVHLRAPKDAICSPPAMSDGFFREPRFGIQTIFWQAAREAGQSRAP